MKGGQSDAIRSSFPALLIMFWQQLQVYRTENLVVAVKLVFCFKMEKLSCVDCCLLLSGFGGRGHQVKTQEQINLQIHLSGEKRFESTMVML